jgi:spore germination cell wall hydrolase CwlJ-like protein
MRVRAGSAAILIAAALGLAACAGQKPPAVPAAAPTATAPAVQLPARQMASLTTGPEKSEPKRIELADADFNCLVQAVYFEAGQEIPEGQRAVAEVILHRVEDPRFPKTVCAVIHDSNPRGCQFSWWCDGKSDRPTEAREVRPLSEKPDKRFAPLPIEEEKHGECGNAELHYPMTSRPGL